MRVPVRATRTVLTETSRPEPAALGPPASGNTLLPEILHLCSADLLGRLLQEPVVCGCPRSERHTLGGRPRTHSHALCNVVFMPGLHAKALGAGGEHFLPVAGQVSAPFPGICQRALACIFERVYFTELLHSAPHALKTLAGLGLTHARGPRILGTSSSLFSDGETEARLRTGAERASQHRLLAPHRACCFLSAKWEYPRSHGTDPKLCSCVL